MRLIRTQDNVPSCYVNESRDFQLLCRLYDCIANGVKFDNDSIVNVLDTRKCNDRILRLLQSKVGFFSDKEMTDDNLRGVLEAFPYILKNKGSKKAIEQSLYLFLKLNGVKTDVNVDIVNNPLTEGAESYTIYVGVKSAPMDTTVLSEIFKYILPSGYALNYIFYESVGKLTSLWDRVFAKVVYTDDRTSSTMRNSSYQNSTVNSVMGTANLTEVIGEDDQWFTNGDRVAYFTTEDSDIVGYHTIYRSSLSGIGNEEYMDKVTAEAGIVITDVTTKKKYRSLGDGTFEEIN